MQLGRVSDLIVNSQMSIRSLTATEWLDTDATADVISAPWIGSLCTLGNRRAGITGDFGADVTLTSAAARQTLASAVIAGQITGGTWEIAGAVGTIRAVGGMAGGWILNGAAGVATLDAGVSALGGTITAGSFGTIRTQGTLTAGITANGVDARGVSINSLTAGKVGNVNLKVPGTINTLTAAEWLDGLIEAAWARTIQITGNRRAGIAGDFGADVNLTGRDARGTSLTTLSIAGTALNSSVRAFGSVSSVVVGASIGSDFLAGVAQDVERQPTERADFVNPLAAIRSFTVQGLPGSKADFFADSNIAASSIGKVSLLNGDFETGNSGIFANGQLAKPMLSVRNRDTRNPARNWTWPAKGNTLFTGPNDLMRIL